ncbi:MAG: HAD family hydrolase [Synoicihabitans sp.]
MRFRTFLFDLDGTLIEHLPAIHRCYAHTLPQLGFPAPTYDEVKRAIGGGLPRAMGKFVPADRIEEALAIYRPYWHQTMLEGVSLMPYATEVLRELKARGWQTAVFTNKHGPSARRLCDHLNITELLDAVVGADDTAWLKPEPKFNDWVLDQLGASPESTCLVGDSPFDVAAALAGPWGFYGVTTGTHAEDQLREAGATDVFSDLKQVATAWGIELPPRG